MNRAVVDASVAAKWFRRPEEEYSEEAQSVLDEHVEGKLQLWAPSLLLIEVLNIAARRWKWSREGLTELVNEFLAFRLNLAEPPPISVVDWASRGLTAYDASYVALAEARGMRLITDDRQVLLTAPEIATPIGDWLIPGTFATDDG